MVTQKITMRNGKVVTNRDRLAQLFQNLKDGEYIVSAKRNNRHSGRYKYYFGTVLATICEQKNIQDAEALHGFYKDLFCVQEIIDPFTGEVTVKSGGSTTTLTDEQFEQFQFLVMEDAANRGVQFQ